MSEKPQHRPETSGKSPVEPDRGEGALETPPSDGPIAPEVLVRREGAPEGSNPAGGGLRRLRIEVKETLMLAWPITIGGLGQMGIQLIDVAMVGHYGSLELGGLALGGTLVSFGFLVSLGILSAIVPQVAHAAGAGDRAACGQALGDGLWVALGLAVFWVTMFQFADPLLQLTGQSPTLTAIALSYVRPVSLGFPAVLGYMALREYVEGLSMTRPAMVISLAALPLNAGLNVVLMYGYFGLPAMGVAGAGLATSITQWLSMLALALFIARSGRFSGYDTGAVFRGPRFTEIRRFLVLALPIGVSLGMEVGVFGAVTLMMGWFGPLPVAAHQAALNFASITFMVPLSFSIAGSIRVGYARGREDALGVQWAGWTTLMLAAGVMCFTALLMVSLPELILSMYTADPEVIRIGVTLLAVGAVFQIFDGIQVAGSSVLRGLKDTRVPMLANILAYWVIGIPVAYGLGVRGGGGPPGLWWGLSAGLAVAALCHILRFRTLLRRM